MLELFLYSNLLSHPTILQFLQFLPNVQILHNYNNFFLSLPLLHMGYILAWTLPAIVLDIQWSHSSSLLSLLEQALLVLTIELSTSLAKPGAKTIIVLVPYWCLLVYSFLEFKLLFLSYLSISSLLSFFLFNIYSDLLPTYTTAQYSWRVFWFH